MGIYLNPRKRAFQKALNSQIYVDKSKLIAYTNKVLDSEQQYVCVSRPRRFGKSMAANMLAAYYGRGTDSKAEFEKLEIGKVDSFLTHLNRYNVIFLNMQEFLSENHDVESMKSAIEKNILWDLLEAYPDIRYFDSENLTRTLSDIYNAEEIPFVFIIDEWDCIFREKKADKEAQKVYLDFLRNLLKDKPYVALAYMTGILPIKKYGSHSALNMFDEFSMTNPKQLAEFTGFTETEVKELCDRYGMDFEETKRWYDGYHFENVDHVYSPRSVVSAMLSRSFDNYWNQTETFEALRDYIVLNYAGLKDIVIELLAGAHKKIETGSFSNDMTTFSTADDVLTLLIHLGYLGYDFSSKEVFIPNSEIASEFVAAIQGAGWEEVIDAVKKSDNLLKAIWSKNAEAVAKGIEEAHFETSILKYNDENSLACVISLAFYSARTYYTEIRELPAGHGFADIVYLPRKNHQDKPAIIVELKWDKSADAAIDQIKKRNYVKALEGYKGNLLLVGVNYDKENKKHHCIMEEYSTEK
ncbi:MAG: ATP-binding protein [Lachnospiraceae bacterium]|nr:ATP-binding protein [Lachnospiraceae bacterium]